MFVLVAEDDEDDRFLLKEALQESPRVERVQFVENGQQLMDYLHQCVASPKVPLCPDLILLDLNMPVKDGRETLCEIKSDPRFRVIPVIVLTTSSSEIDIIQCYGNGANSYITKPMGFSDLVAAMKTFQEYWLDVARIPKPQKK